MSKQLVCVTGANGYLAGELIKQLLNKGYFVRGTTRNKNDINKVGYLKEFPGSERLELFEANLLKEGDFDEVFKGCSAVFHVASPVAFVTLDPQKELIEPALKGTTNVLNSVEKNRETVKRVIVTSSIAAITNLNDLGKTILDKDRIFTESDWNLTSSLKDGPYRFSKRLSEEATWNWFKKTGIETVTVLPSLVIGRLNNHRTKKEDLNFSMVQIKRYLIGEAKLIAPGGIGIVDVEDVAKAHILALETPQASGNRYICSANSLSNEQICKIIRSRFSSYPVPTEIDPNPNPSGGYITCGFPPKFSNEKIKKELGMEFKLLEETITNACNALIEGKFADKI